MKRGEPLRPDPDKVREWLRKSRHPLKRGKPLERGKGLERGRAQLERRAPLQPGKRKRRWRVPAALRKEVLGRTSGLCAACLARRGLNPDLAPQAVRRARRAGVRWAVHLHHVLPVERWPEHERNVDNLVGVCAECHDDHERANARIPAEAVPGCAFALARLAGPAEADYIAKTYPCLGAEPGGTGRSG